MVAGLRMLGGVLARRGIAAGQVITGQTASQVHPLATVQGAVVTVRLEVGRERGQRGGVEMSAQGHSRSFRRVHILHLAAPEPGRGQPGHDLPRRDQPGAGGEGRVETIADHVVVVAMEGPARDAELLGKGVQLRVRDITDQVGPQPPVPRPGRLIDEDQDSLRRTVASISVRQVRTRSAST